MTHEETIEKLQSMRLGAMALAVKELDQEAPSQELSFHERLGLIVDREWTDRENRRLSRLMRAAKLPTQACVEDVACEAGRGISKAQLRDFESCKWISSHHNIIVVGKTGCGKTYLGAALAQLACRQGYRALCVRLSRLLHDLALAHAEGTYINALAKLAKLDVLVLDDFLLAPLKDQERRDLLEVLEDRYDRKSTVITTQVPTKNWHDLLGDPTIADAICDRVVHNAHVLGLKGQSMRKRKGMGTQPTN